MNTDICFICCKPSTEDRDHVVPSCLFVKPLPNNLLTLPAHHQCHDKLREEYFRNIVAWLCSNDSVTANTLWNGKIDRSFQRSRPLRDSVRWSLRRRIDLVSSSGIWLGQAPGIQIDRGRFYPTPEKIVRGLYRHHLGRFLPADAAFDAWGIYEPRLIQQYEPLLLQQRRIFQLSKPALSYADVFESWFDMQSEDGVEWAAWQLRFYKGLVIRCRTTVRIARISQDTTSLVPSEDL